MSQFSSENEHGPLGVNQSSTFHRNYFMRWKRWHSINGNIFVTIMDCLVFSVSIGHLGFQISLNECVVLFMNWLCKSFIYIFLFCKVMFFYLLRIITLSYIWKICKSISFACMPVLTIIVLIKGKRHSQSLIRKT